MRRVLLPDHTAVWAFSRFEARLVYREVVTDRTYELHGITLPAGAAVFDVGANIGLYAIRLVRTVPNVRVRCFEPLPLTFSALEQNLAEHAPAVTAVRAGLGAAAGAMTFEFDRFSSITSTMTPADVSRAADRSASFAQWVSAALADLERVEPGRIVSLSRRLLSHPASRPLMIVALGGLAACLDFRKRLFLKREQCEIRTVSAELASSGFDGLDLVKIDVEGGEESVLSGIADTDWLRIRQFVIEVHDVDGRLDRIAADLRRRGYQVTHDREDWALHALMRISTLYAIRPGD